MTGVATSPDPSVSSSEHFLEGIRHTLQSCGFRMGMDRLVVGLSGGVDSVVLVALLCEAGICPDLVHVNYGLRAEAEEDEAFVRQFAASLALPLHIVAAGPAPSSGRQEWARKVRYRVFLEHAIDLDARFVAVAHHADDQLETILLNLERGTGLGGLVGMRPCRAMQADSSVSLVRPLLRATRAQVVETARMLGVAWREDVSNQDPTYSRNALRAELSRLSIEELTGLRDQAMLLSDRVGEARHTLRSLLTSPLGSEGDKHTLAFKDVDGFPPLVQSWIIMEWLTVCAPGLPRRQSDARAILSLRGAQPGRTWSVARADLGMEGTPSRVPCVTVWRERAGWRLEVAHPAGEDARAFGHLDVESVTIPPAAQTDPWSWLQSRPGETSDAEAFVCYLDADALPVGAQSTFELAPWKSGDRFRPFGMRGTRKIKKYLADRSVPPSSKAHVPVLYADGHVVWVVGHQIDDRYAVRPQTRQVLVCRVS